MSDENEKKERSFLPTRWMSEGVPFTDKRDKQAIQNDKWDREDLSKMLKQLPSFNASRKALADFTDTGADAMADTFWTFLKSDPELSDPERMKPSHIVNRAVMDEMMKLDEIQRLRRYCIGDDVQAALSSTTVEPDLETLFDKLKTQQQQANGLEQALQDVSQANQEKQDLDDLVKRWGEDRDNDQELTDEEKQQAEQFAKEQAEAAKKLAEAQAEAQKQAEELEKKLDRAGSTIRGDLRKALDKAAGEAQENSENMQAWGVEPGEAQRMDAKERMELAKRLNNPRFKRIADLFGPMRNLMFSEQQRKVIHAKDEVYDVTIGSDLGRILPQELLSLSNPASRKDFHRRYAEGKLLQYDMRGEERLARGGIILCEDGSGSMRGERELWAKAVMLTLLHLARQQKRTMHVIHFGGPGQVQQISFVQPSDFTLDRILSAAELFFGGGTDFQTPMDAALRTLQQEHLATGGVKADVIFLTDDECGVAPTFMKHYLDEMERMQSTTWGISVSGMQPSAHGALVEMSQNKVATIKDFLSGEDVRTIFRGV